jgi:hypothetical protein
VATQFQELAKQMQKYADAITIFSVVQAIGFTLTVAQNERVGCIINKKWTIAAPAIVASYLVYAGLIYFCRRAEQICLMPKVKEDDTHKVLHWAYIGRLVLLAITAAGLVALIVGTGLGAVPDCPGSAKEKTPVSVQNE